MGTWFTVYCKRSVRSVTVTDLTAALGAVDFYTVAEGFGIEDEQAIGRAVSALRVQPATGELAQWFEVHYRPVNHRPLTVFLWADPRRVKQELAEAGDEYLAGRKGKGVAQVRAALSAVVEVVGIELGLGHLEDMGRVIGGQVAEYLARVGAGLIRDTGDEWWAVRRGVPKLLLARPS